MIYGIQVVTGILLAGLFNNGIPFLSVDFIMREDFMGWLVRCLHIRLASFLFFFLFMHFGRGLYYKRNSKLFLTWTIGVVLLIVFMLVSFLGYVLPWGQMSFWGAAVITKFLTVIPFVGEMIAQWVWGGFGVGDTTVMRFFRFHVILPLVGAVIILAHIASLHTTGSGDPLGRLGGNWISFLRLFRSKDLVGFLLLGFLVSVGVLYFPSSTMDAANFEEANPMVTPTHIKPEWYFLAAYAVLRSVPNKAGGVIGMCAAVVVHIIYPLIKKFSIGNNYLTWFLLMTFVELTWLGGVPAEEPFIIASQVFRAWYFLMCLV